MGTIVLRDGVIFDGHSPELLDGADVLIVDGEIKEVSERPLKTTDAPGNPPGRPFSHARSD